MSDNIPLNGIVIPIPREFLTDDEIDDSERLRRIGIQIEHLVDEVHALKARADETEAMVRKLIAEISPILGEIIPMISNFAENPMVRMLMKGKK
jgi:hypothetical protein